MLLSGLGQGKLIDFRRTAMERFKVDTDFIYEIEDKERLVNWRSERATINPFYQPGHQVVEKQNECEIADVDNSKNPDVSQHGTLYRCPRSPCISHFIRSERRDQHLLQGVCKIIVPHPTMLGRVKAMYISAYGISFHEHYNTKQKDARSMVMHLEDLPSAEVYSFLDQADTPLAKANADFNSLFLKGFALPVPSKRTIYTEDQLEYIQEKFDKGRRSPSSKADPEEVAQEMRFETVVGEDGIERARFPPNLWLRAEQIKYLFSKIALDIRSGDIQETQEFPPPNEFVDEAQQAESEEQIGIFDANAELDSVNQVIRLAQQVTDEDITEHPMMINDISICTLADCIKTDPQYDLVVTFEPAQIVEVLLRIGHNNISVNDFYGKSEDDLEELNTLMKRLIFDFVQAKCGCIL